MWQNEIFLVRSFVEVKTHERRGVGEVGQARSMQTSRKVAKCAKDSLGWIPLALFAALRE